MPRGIRHGLYGTPTHRAWRAMMNRCQNPKYRRYDRYGGRGIKVCSRWESFTNFVTDMGLKPAGSTLDRFPNNDGNYEPGNCRWVTQRENCRNKSNNRMLTHNGVTKTLVEWAEELGIPYEATRKRLKRGWSTAAALFTPYRAKAAR